MAEIKKDVIVLKNGTLRAILAVSAINFDLKSSEEQEAIINQYQNFLNSIEPIKKLSCPIIIEEDIKVKDLSYVKKEIEFIKNMF